MEHGILKVSETRIREIEANEAFIALMVTSDKIAFGNAAKAAAQNIEPIIKFIETTDPNVHISTESVQIVSASGFFTKGSRAIYTLKVATKRLDKLGEILGRCSEGKDVTVLGVSWGYEDEATKQELITEAVRMAKAKAEQMMGAIGYRVVGIRSCSDSYSVPNIGEVIVSGSELGSLGMQRKSRRIVSDSVAMGTDFTNHKEVTATCTIEFVITPGDGASETLV